VNAGHNPPLLVRTDGTILELEATGRILGVFGDAVYGSGGPAALRPGDAVFLFTDGIVEARNRADEMYGEDRFRASLAARAREAKDARTLLDRVLADLARFTEGHPPSDDLTCLVLRVL
jgi:sigma-B regulation protein RsbU (phosphoserine phosphatase)